MSKITIEVTLPERWIDCTIWTPDLFSSYGTGSWGTGVWYQEAGDICWLIWDKVAAGDRPTQGEIDAAYDWRGSTDDTPCPSNWYVINDTQALEIYAELVKRYGEAGAQNADAPRLDVAVQTVLFGEVRYV